MERVAGIGGARPSFGTAKPMKGGPGGSAFPAALDEGGEQFPPIEEFTPPMDLPPAELGAGAAPGGAMDRLTARQNGAGDQASSRAEGFEASSHRIKEQVLPRLLERVDPEAAATLSKDELAEEFRPIISEVLAELKITLNRRDNLHSRRCWSTNYWVSDRSRNSSPIPRSATSW